MIPEYTDIQNQMNEKKKKKTLKRDQANKIYQEKDSF